ncbi:hypothetical protein [Streptomyces sp. XD-27]|uniref:hypothetical protein n=1 Tax=Streptomyces sp. XD-27 TaxID=3062779 RepID=UPI0026F42032|nr:hypothetical protein [Streptomyces sp. XD-27]WKX72578.1 hypothetical protein Q3Y56_24135 [Streptomyces sp. XD-27]
MKLGVTNDAGADKTELKSSASQTLAVTAAGQIGIMAETTAGNGVGAFGVAPQIDGCVGLWGFGGHGVIGGSDEGTGTNGWSHGVFGVRGVTDRDGPAVSAVCGVASGTDSVGVVGEANHGPAAIGVWGKAAEGYAGYFSGPVYVSGYLYKSGGGFLIDHPLDPENRYLRHSFVESDQQLNVYSGTAVTDGDGSAVITLPEYFEELNEDFRYQLTVIGAFARAMVSEEVRDNRFTIATDRPEVKVSWQVTGVRRDRVARSNPFTAAEPKPEEERGTYLHPEAWDRPAESGAEYARERALREAHERFPFLDKEDRLGPA